MIRNAMVSGLTAIGYQCNSNWANANSCNCLSTENMRCDAGIYDNRLPPQTQFRHWIQIFEGTGSQIYGSKGWPETNDWGKIS